ncbi:archaeal/vacuolar-type H+-ATPase subunit F [Aciduliprofundum sp. MAR08-339]|uniref:V-type ATP synthase subunit F n=1 Tax=Aciduliprofundum sp. (strain MAR08-339) TaxID=673860 RepID=UPI0002A4CB11|nr:archaeal/vacuolar-type H+-ATPase subunit F [Aciduliprofundum sp. MAR08-339]
MKILVIGDRDMVNGFQLAGIKDVYEANDPWKIKEILDDVKFMKDVAIVIISRRMAQEIRDFLDEWKREKGIYPIILEIPDKKGGEFEDPMRSLVKRAIGVDILKR